MHEYDAETREAYKRANAALRELWREVRPAVAGEDADREPENQETEELAPQATEDTTPPWTSIDAGAHDADPQPAPTDVNGMLRSQWLLRRGY